MDIDEARRHDSAFCVDDFLCFHIQIVTNFLDFSVFHENIFFVSPIAVCWGKQLSVFD